MRNIPYLPITSSALGAPFRNSSAQGRGLSPAAGCRESRSRYAQGARELAAGHKTLPYVRTGTLYGRRPAPYVPELAPLRQDRRATPVS